MKKILIMLAFALSSNMISAQEVVKLEETKVNFDPSPMEIIDKGNSYLVKIKENAIGDFESDPLSFIDTYFDINQLIAKTDRKKYDSYQVTFKSRKGTVNSEFSKSGILLFTSMKFVNVAIPHDLQHQLYRDYKGWALTKTIHVAKGRNGSLNSNYYLLTMQNGNQQKNLRINTKDISERA